MYNPFDFNFTHAIVTRVPNSIKEATYPNRNLLASIQSGKLDHFKQKVHTSLKAFDGINACNTMIEQHKN